MLHDPGGHPPDPRIRLIALAGVVACAVALPLAVASAGPAGDEGHTVVRAPARASVRASPRPQDAKAPSVAPARSPLLLDLGLDTAVRCGPELTSPDGVEAQTCVLSQGEDTWARTYYRNATGRALDAFLSLMGPAGRTVQTRCTVAAEDEPQSCETPHEPSRGKAAAYTAVTEFAEAIADGPLLLRSGSNFPSDTGS